MEDREKITIKTPVAGHTVVLKAYLTGREKRDIANGSMPTNVDYDLEDGVKGLNPIQIMNNGEDASLKAVIISIDDIIVGEDAPNKVLDMHSDDSDFIIAKVKEVVTGLSEEKKTT